jgi:putative addiction module component (TIGR02574 family)
MTETADKLRIELSQLSIQERAELAYFLIQSLDQEVDADVVNAWNIELTRRMQEINRGNAAGEPSAKVFSELRVKYS